MKIIRSPWCLAGLLATLITAQLWAQEFRGPAGTYTVTTPGPVHITYGPSSVTITWDSAAPTPPPPAPAPVPTPAPPPPAPAPVPRIVGTIYVLAISDPPTPLRPTFSADLKAYWYALSTKSDHAGEWLDDDAVKAIGTPCLILATENAAGKGIVSYATKLPAAEADVVSIVRQSRGLH